MPVPSHEGFLANLYRVMRDCEAFMNEAVRRGDAREVKEFREHMDRVESMIDQSGGDPDA
jgi:hypothetical protein